MGLAAWGVAVVDADYGGDLAAAVSATAFMSPVSSGTAQRASLRAGVSTQFSPGSVYGMHDASEDGISTAPLFMATMAALATGLATLVARGRKQPRSRRMMRAGPKSEVLPKVDRDTTKAFTRDLKKSENYFKFNRKQMQGALEELKSISGSELLTKLRKNGFRLTVGDVTLVLAQSYGFCWGVERAVAMAYEARRIFPDQTIWVTNELIHNPLVNSNLEEMGLKILQTEADGTKDFSQVQEGDVAVLPAFGASIDEMALLKERGVQIVDASCPWVTKVWNSVERGKSKGATAVIHGKYDHEETMATKSIAKQYLVVRDMKEAEYVARYILGQVKREDFMAKFALAMSENFDPDVDLDRVGVSNQTTMLKGETELIGKLFERVMLRKYGPQNINDHFISFNTICDATQERQDAMYDMFFTQYVPPVSDLYSELEAEQEGMKLMSDHAGEALSSKAMEDATRGANESGEKAQQKVDMCLVIGGFNSSNTAHLAEIALEEGVPAYHIDCAKRIGDTDGKITNKIQFKPVHTPPDQAMMDQGLEIMEGFLPDGPVTIGISSGASTPDSAVGECLERILALRLG